MYFLDETIESNIRNREKSDGKEEVMRNEKFHEHNQFKTNNSETIHLLLNINGIKKRRIGMKSSSI